MIGWYHHQITPNVHRDEHIVHHTIESEIDYCLDWVREVIGILALLARMCNVIAIREG